MTTRILDLPLLSFDMIVGTNEDWRDSWAYLDASSAPISLAGLTLNFEVRKTAADSAVALIASTAGLIGSAPVNGFVVVGGTGGNVVGLNIPAGPIFQRTRAGPYVWELQAVGDGITRTIGTGNVTVVQGIVR